MATTWFCSTEVISSSSVSDLAPAMRPAFMRGRGS
jgi:hypothetical protein